MRTKTVHGVVVDEEMIELFKTKLQELEDQIGRPVSEMAAGMIGTGVGRKLLALRPEEVPFVSADAHARAAEVWFSAAHDVENASDGEEVCLILFHAVMQTSMVGEPEKAS